jgi:hypothetical protein
MVGKFPRRPIWLELKTCNWKLSIRNPDASAAGGAPDWLRSTFSEAGSWSSLSIETGEVRGFDGRLAQMLFVVARKSL